VEGFEKSQDNWNDWTTNDVTGCIVVYFRKVSEDFDGDMNSLLVALGDDCDDFLGNCSDNFKSLICSVAVHEFDSLKVLRDSL